MEFTRESLGLLKLKDGDINLRGLAKKKGIQLKKGANKKDVINAILSQRAGYDVSRKAPPPPPNMTQAQAKVEIKKRLDIMARERYDRDTLLTTAQERREQVNSGV